MSAIFEEIRAEVDAAIERVKATISDGGFSFAKAIALTTDAIGFIVTLTERFKTLSGAEKKAIALEAVDYFYSKVIGPLDIPGVPEFVEGTILDPLLGNVLHNIASGVIDGIVATYNRVGWPK